MPEYDEDYDGIPDAEESPGGGDPKLEALREINRILRSESIQPFLGEEDGLEPEIGAGPLDGEPPMEDEDLEEGMAPPARKPKSLSIIIGSRKGKK